MKKISTKVMVSLAAGFGLFISGASYAGWYEGDCAAHYAAGNNGVCIEYLDSTSQWWHINSHPGGSSSFKGPFITPPTQSSPLDHNNYHSGDMGDFRFCGDTTLVCTAIGTVECNLCLDGRVNKTGNLAQIQILGGTVTPGDDICSSITMRDFPWWVDIDHNYSSTGGIPITNSSGIYTGNVGNTVFNVGGILNIDGDVHDVAFHNNDPAASFFRLSSSAVNNIFPLIGHVQACTLSGDMNLSSPYADDINVRYAP